MTLHVLNGPNFSGKTNRLREWVGLPSDQGADPVYSGCAYIGPNPSSALSGIAPTVSSELEFMAADNEAAKVAIRAVDNLGFGYCLRQNPFTLSGGEQVVIAVAAAVASRARRIAIDSALEQLSADVRSRLLGYIAGVDCELMIADNRLAEWYDGPTEVFLSQPNTPVVPSGFIMPIDVEPVEIELLDISFAYVRSRPVLKDCSFRFVASKAWQLNGDNGSGKSTLSKILSGLLKPSSGEIRVNGKPVKPWKTPGKFVGYHFQDPDYQLFASNVSSQLAHARRHHDFLMKAFALESFSGHHPLDLPFTIKKRLALASICASGRGFLVLDEPTLGQDQINACNIRDMILKSSVTPLVISHSRLYSHLPAIRMDAINACSR